MSTFLRRCIGLALWLGCGLAAFAQSSLPHAQVGVAYSFQVTTNPAAGAGSVYAATGLPSGILINASSGLIGGTTSTAGTYSGNISITLAGVTNNLAYVLVVDAAAGTPAITSATTASGTMGQAFTYSTTASGSPTSFNITGLPAGLSANTTNGQITGTPTAAGTSQVSLSANNGSGTGAVTTLTITIAASSSVPAITSAGTANGQLSQAFAFALTASNSPLSFSASGLPLGLTLDSATGAIGGTPQVTGVSTVTVSATNNAGTGASSTLVITIGDLPAITSAATASSTTVGGAFSFTLTASNTPTSFNITGLPSWLSANTATGALTATSAVFGAYTLTVSANNSVGTGPTSTLTIRIGSAPTITSAATASGTAGTPFSFTVTGSNSPTGFTASGLPAGLTINATTGAISGTPAVTGSVAVSVGATNAIGTGTATLTINLSAASGGGGGGGGGGGFNPFAITSVTNATAVAKQPFSFQITTSTAASSFAATNLPEGVLLNTATGVISGEFQAAGVFVITVSASNSTQTTNNSLTVTVTAAPTFSLHPTGRTVAPGGTTTLTGAGTGTPAPTYQWRRNGVDIAGATAADLTLSNFDVASAGAYTLVLINSAGSTVSQPAVVSLASTAKVAGAGTEVGQDIRHPTGNIYDQILLTGAAATITADPGQVTRISYIDLNDDIVQVEFAGAGTLTLLLDAATGPALPKKYNQSVEYMKGHATILIVGANETTNASVFSVGRANAVNQALFRDSETYDGFADIASISISSVNGKFGGLRTANGSYFNTTGTVGVNAPGVEFTGPVFVGDIDASGTATPYLTLGGGADVRITGGNLFQSNRAAVQVSGITQLKFTAGTTSHGVPLTAQTNQARLMQNGTDVTTQIVVNP